MATTPRIAQPLHPDLVSREQAAVMIGCSSAHIAKTKPFYEYYIAPKCIRIDRVEVEQFIAAKAAKR